MKLSVQDVHRIQTMLVDIWQAHIQSFTEDAQGATVQPPAPPPAPPAQPHLAAPQPQAQPAQAVPAERRGHVIQARPDGGLFCVKCGKQTQYTKHLRAKILNKVWRNKDLPQARWLTAPGRMQATSRLDDLQANLQDVLNTGHRQIVWNRKNGKNADNPATYRLIYCLACGRSWPWKHRHANFSKTTCRPVSPTPTAPEWVTADMERAMQVQPLPSLTHLS